MMQSIANVPIVSLVAIGLLAGCTVSDASSSNPPPMVLSSVQGAEGVRISGLSNLRQTALVLTDQCRTASYETDRQAFAQVALIKGLAGYAPAFPNGIAVDVQPMSLRMRCHSSGLAALLSYCEAEAKVGLTAGGTTRASQVVSVTVAKEASERAQLGLACISTMPAVTAAVDKALMDAIAGLQADLTAQTGLPAPR
ncbi:MAG: hypothetical protein EPO41_28850 [Reyranella sp.]|uniref:hypothetical protein n=1 Tax=Reyranella sp. TaxID=1929291 RepID=UPI0012050843|nr:hypothetical protein [Reyranella sp.]TAJ84388.1 MAG: hypothetical protein EPO41_28850 [Reyranella sp.]